MSDCEVERHEKGAGGEFGAWTLNATALQTEISLTGQPRAVEMEYRVLAVNNGGKSTPSNTVMVVL